MLGMIETVPGDNELTNPYLHLSIEMTYWLSRKRGPVMELMCYVFDIKVPHHLVADKSATPPC